MRQIADLTGLGIDVAEFVGERRQVGGIARSTEEIDALLRGIGVRLVRQEGAEISALLASAADPESGPPRAGALSSGLVEGTW